MKKPGKGINYNTLRSVHLHNDGHAVLLHERNDKNAGKIQWAEIFQEFGPKCNFEGKIVLTLGESVGVSGLLKKANEVSVKDDNTLVLKGNDFDVEVLSEFALEDSDESWEDVKNLDQVNGVNVGTKHLVKVAKEAAQV